MSYIPPPDGGVDVEKLTSTIAGQTQAEFPYAGSKPRLADYDYYEKLFLGDHFEAFKMKIADPAFNRAYAKLRYISINFAGMLSKIVADMLFSEPITIRVGDDGDQEFVDALVFENKLNQQFYEAALSNSYFGDQVFKLRVDKKNKRTQIIIEDNTPKVYFPTLDPTNMRAEPSKHEFAWVIAKAGKKYVRKEIHEIGKIYNEIWELKDDGTVGSKLTDIKLFGLEPEEDTKIDRSLVIHTPNFRISGRYLGISDYNDLDSIFFAINNRFSKIDNVLDLHTDPILAVPEGILDEDGKVKRQNLQMIEISPEAGKEKPEYIVWNANLEAAFSQIDRLVESFFMTSEISPAVLGMDKGGAVESGRALKLKLLRTIAKVSRKKLYFHQSIIEVIYTAQILAKAWGASVDGKKLTKDPQKPELVWQDGLPIDDSEQIDDEIKRKDGGLTTTKDSLMRIDNLTDKEAEEKAAEIEEENKIEMPVTAVGDNPFGKTDPKANPPVPPKK